MKIKSVTKQDNGHYVILYGDCVIMSKTDVTSPTDRLTDEEQLRADLCEYIVKLETELKRWKDVSSDRTNLEYIISLENRNKELEAQHERDMCCGNCKHYNTQDCREYKIYWTRKGFETYQPNGAFVCDKWEGENE